MADATQTTDLRHHGEPAQATTDLRQHGEPAPPLQLGGPDEVMIFVRAEGFYPIQGVQGVPLGQQAEDHAVLNPGTLRIEDMAGNVLWRLQ